MSFYNVAYLTLWRTPAELYRICEIPTGSVLLPENDVQGDFTKVTYRASRDFTGYVKTSLLDVITNPLPTDIVELPEQTYSLQDLKQYVKLFGNIQFNLCGQISVAMIVGEKRLVDLLDKWKIKEPTKWERVFPNRFSKPTGLTELISMLTLYQNVDDMLYLRTVLFNKDVGRVVMTPARLQVWMDAGWHLLIGVKIDSKGWLRDKGTPHWVVLYGVEPAGILDGTVTLYNPASNGMEQYSWDEFETSAGTPYGLFIKTV